MSRLLDSARLTCTGREVYVSFQLLQGVFTVEGPEASLDRSTQQLLVELLQVSGQNERPAASELSLYALLIMVQVDDPELVPAMRVMGSTGN